MTSSNWMWDYFTSRNSMAKCNICDIHCSAEVKEADVIKHMTCEHWDIYDTRISFKSSNDDWNSLFCTTQNSQIVCKFCDTNFTLNIMHEKMIRHLSNVHSVNEDTADEIYTWLHEHYIFAESNTTRCKYCNNMSFINSSLILLKHLIDAHQIYVPVDIRPIGLSSNLSSFSNSDGCCADIATSEYQQPTFSFDNDYNAHLDV